jgi:small GTP-binding protein
MRYKGQDVDVTIVDTQGQDEQEIFRNEYCLGAHGYILVFSIASPRSLSNLEVINAKLVNLMGTNRIARVLVGNKSDLEGDRRVPRNEARRIAELWESPYIECSAKQNTNIDDVFRLALQQIDYFSDGDQRSSSFSSLSSYLSEFACCDSTWRALTNPVRSIFESQTWERRHTSISTLLWFNVLCGLVAFAASICLMVLDQAEKRREVLAIALLVVGLLQTLLSSMGLFGLRSDERRYLRLVSDCPNCFAIFYSHIFPIICVVLRHDGDARRGRACRGRSHDAHPNRRLRRCFFISCSISHAGFAAMLYICACSSLSDVRRLVRPTSTDN